MSQRSSGLKAPASRLARPATGLSTPRSAAKHLGALEKSARAAGLAAPVAEHYAHSVLPKLSSGNSVFPKLSSGSNPDVSLNQTAVLDDFKIGDRVWVSGSKPGRIAYIGETQFTTGEWAGVVLDEPVGKNDGSVAGVRYFQCEAKRGVFSRVTKLFRSPQDGDMSMNVSMISSAGGSGGTPQVSSSNLARSTPNGSGSGSVDRGDFTAISSIAPSGGGSGNSLESPYLDSSLMPPPAATVAGRQMTSTPARPSHTSSTSGLARKTPLTSSQTNLNVSHIPHHSEATRQASSASSGATTSGFVVGERVLVSGSKAGTLRFLGPTDFAPGDWAGVELDDPQGKNDGSVAGKGYFDCKPMYGIFAKTNKVSKLPLGGTPTPTSAPSHTTPRPRGSGAAPNNTSMTSSMTSSSKYGIQPSLRRSEQRTGSQDSISSLGSSLSTSSRSRVRLGVTSLTHSSATHGGDTASVTSARSSGSAARQRQALRTSKPKPITLAAENTSLQKALKEKEEHIDQLLQERDMERSELARTSALADTAEGQLASLKSEVERLEFEKDETLAQLSELAEKCEALETSNKQLNIRLEEEQRKVEELQFFVAEATILQDEQETMSTESAQAVGRVKELEEKYKKEKERADSLDTKLANAKAHYQDYKAKAKDAEDTSVAYLDQIEELTHKLTLAETRVNTLTVEKQSSGAKSSEIESALFEKDERIMQLESQLQQNEAKVKQLTNRLRDTEEELTESIKSREKQQETVDELTQKVLHSETTASNLTGEIKQLKTQLADLQRQLTSSVERSQQLEQDKTKLENQITDLMQNSGDSCKQLSLLNEDMLDKERRLQECKAALCDSTREVGRLHEELLQQREAIERETTQLASKHQQEIASLHEKISSKQSELEKLEARLEKQQSTASEEQEAHRAQREREVGELRRQLETREAELRRVEERERNRAEKESSSGEVETLKFEKEKLDKQLKKLESEKADLVQERDDVINERDILAGENRELQERRESSYAELTSLRTEMDRLKAEKQQLTAARDQLKSASESLEKENEVLEKAQGSSSTSLQEQEATIRDLREQLELAQTEAACERESFEQQQQQVSDQLHQLQERLSNAESGAGESRELRERLKVVETEREALKLQVNALRAKEQERKQLEKQQEAMNAQISELQTSSATLKEEFAAEKQQLQSELGTTAAQLQQQTEDVYRLKTEMAKLQGENMSIKSYQSTIQGLEIDRKNLQQELAKMKASLNQVTAFKADHQGDTADPALAQLQEEKEDAERQVSFLNSVIVDLQHKNSELSERLAAMENGGLLNGASDSLEEHLPRKPAPRLFCDICDVFDLHDTEDCPTQAMEDEAPPSQHHGNRGQKRPFCDVCEVFGHTTEECDDEQTF